MSLLFDFKNVFISIPLNISDIEIGKDSNIDESKNFNANVQIYLVFEKEYKEFIIIRVNLNIVRNDSKEYLYKENNLYFEFNNAGYNDIIQMNCIYNYYTFYLGLKAIYNFFFRTIFRLIKKVYRKEKTKHWILTIRTTIYRTFIPSPEHPPIYIKKGATLEGY